MPPITLEELLKDKKELEITVFRLLNDFQIKNGVSIIELNLLVVEGNIDFKKTSLVRVEANIKI